jgi:hypothetical protein
MAAYGLNDGFERHVLALGMIRAAPGSRRLRIGKPTKTRYYAR